MEADFQHYYGLDLIDFYRGTLSPRRTAVLALNLPPGAAVWREYGGPLAWTQDNHLQAAEIYILQLANWQRTGKSGNKPKPLTPPDGANKAVKARDRIEARAAAYLERQKQTE